MRPSDERMLDPDDITGQFNSVESALAQAQALRTSLPKQLQGAVTEAQVQSIEAQLSDVNQKIAAAASTRSTSPEAHTISSMSATDGETIELLHRVPVFSTLGEDDLRRIAEVAVPRRYAAGEVVFREGDESSTCYVVRSGHARAIREHRDGRQITLATFGPGDIFGELAMFDDERRSATVEATEPTEAIAILAGDMRRLLREHPEIAVKLLSALAQKLRTTNERLARQSFQTVQSRVAAVLSQLVQAAGDEGAFDGDVLITSTQAELAQLAGSSRESASRFLAVLERAGIITQGRGKLVVHQPEALQRYVY